MGIFPDRALGQRHSRCTLGHLQHHPPGAPTVIIALQVLSVLQLPICVLPIAGQRLAEGARAGHTVTGPIVRQGQRKGVAPPTGDADDPPPVGAP